MKGLLNIYSLVMICLVMTTSAMQAQVVNERCGHSQYLQNLDNAYPGFSEAVNRTFEEAKARGAASRQAGRSVVYTIPVVVHIVYVTGQEDQNLSDDMVEDQIRILNEDYRRMNADAGNLRSDFNDIVGDPMIEFDLVQTIRVETPARITPDLVSLWDGIKHSSSGGSDAVDPTKHLNIWVGELWTPFGPLFQILGYAYPPAGLDNWPPGASAPTLSDEGVVIDYRAFASNNPSSSFYENQGISIEGRTTVHEVGHYLGLRHIWGDNDPFNPQDGCGLDDGLDDTPNVSENSQAAGCNPSRNTCEAGLPNDKPDMWENYMDYSQETCQVAFTNEQIDVMRGVLEGPRADLVEEPSCAVPETGEITGVNEALVASTETYSIPASGNTIEWTVTGGSISAGAGTNSITVVWGTGANGQVCVTEADGACVGVSECVDVTLNTVAGIAEIAYQKGLEVFPNPASSFIRVHANEVPDRIEIFNLLGAIVRTIENPTSQNEIELSGISENILLIKVSFSDGFAMERIVVE